MWNHQIYIKHEIIYSVWSQYTINMKTEIVFVRVSIVIPDFKSHHIDNVKMFLKDEHSVDGQLFTLFADKNFLAFFGISVLKSKFLNLHFFLVFVNLKKIPIYNIYIHHYICLKQNYIKQYKSVQTNTLFSGYRIL